MLYILIKFLLGWAIMLLFRARVYNRAGLRVSGKAIVVSNHIALFDPVMLAIANPRLMHFMAKKELFESWIGRLFFKSLLAFPVNRHTADLRSLKQAMSVLEKGRVFGIFPEGSRSRTGELGQLEKGAAFLALRSGAPVIPAYIAPDSYKRMRFRAIIGEEISREGLSSGRSEAIDEFTQRIAASFESLKSELEDIMTHADTGR